MAMKFAEEYKDELIKLNAGLGDFYVTSAGMHPEIGHCFFYKDDKHEFFFYGNWSEDLGKRLVTIFDASVERLRGPSPMLPKNDVATIEENITYLFKNRRFFFVGKPIIPEETLDEVVFTWKVAR